MLAREGVQTGIDLDALHGVVAWLGDALGRKPSTSPPEGEMQ